MALGLQLPGVLMRPRERREAPQRDLFRSKLVNLIDVRHELCRLAERIRWQGLVDQFGALYAEQGRPGVPIRLMVGLHYLKHAYGLSMKWSSRVGWRIRTGDTFAARSTFNISCRSIRRR